MHDLGFQSLVQWIKDLDCRLHLRLSRFIIVSILGLVDKRLRQPRLHLRFSVCQVFQSLVQWIKDLDLKHVLLSLSYHLVSILGLVDKRLRQSCDWYWHQSRMEFQSLVQWIKDLDIHFYTPFVFSSMFQSLVQWIKDLDLSRNLNRFQRKSVSILGLVDKRLRHRNTRASCTTPLKFQSLVQWIKDLDVGVVVHAHLIEFRFNPWFSG